MKCKQLSNTKMGKKDRRFKVESAGPFMQKNNTSVHVCLHACVCAEQNLRDFTSMARHHRHRLLLRRDGCGSTTMAGS